MPRPTSWIRYAAATTAGLLAGATVAWSAMTLFAPPPPPLDEAEFATAEATVDEISSTLSLSTTATWPSTAGGTNQAMGTVTSVDVTPGQEVGQGQRLYTVDLRPVVAAVGTVPSFRTLDRGAKGADVQQLQKMLVDLGHLKAAPDGTFSSSTTSAVKRWQRSLGLPPDGVVPAGDIVFTSALPARVVIDSRVVEPGKRLEGGETVLSILAGDPQFSLHLTSAQAAAILSGTRVIMTSPTGAEWPAVTGERRSTDDEVVISVAGEGGASVCGDQCAEIPAIDDTLLRSQVVTIEPQEGIVVPTAALVTDADGEVAVIDARGTRHPVRVVVSAKGSSIVEGIDAGTRVRLPVSGR